MRQITVDLYDVASVDGTPGLETILQAQFATPFGQRHRVCGAVTVQLEHIIPVSANGVVTHWRLAFSRFREEHWPASGSTNAPAVDLNLPQGTLLVEETYALYVPATSRLVLQYSHAGVRSSKIADYLTQCTGAGAQGYRFSPVVNRSILDEYRQKREVAKMHVVVDDISNADIARFEGTRISQMINSCVESNAKRMELKFSVELRSKDQALSGGLVGAISNRLRRRRNPGDSLLLEARHDEFDRLHHIDLLAATKSKTYSESQVIRTAGKRYESQSMFRLLERALQELG